MPFQSTGPVKRVAISGVTSGNNTLVAAVAGKRIRVIALAVQALSAVTFRLEDGAGGDEITGLISLDAKTPFYLHPSEAGWGDTTAATLLNMELGSGVQVSGALVYQEVEN